MKSNHEDEDAAVLIPQIPTPKPLSPARPLPVKDGPRMKFTDERIPGKRIKFKTKWGPFTI